MTDVKILIKNVYAPAETQQFVVVDTLQIRTLKEMLALALPGNPPPKHQKLIFGGKICDDDHSLAKVLAGQSASAQDATQEDTAPFVFHLMVPRSRPTTPVSAATATAAPTPTQTPVPVASAASTPAQAEAGDAVLQPGASQVAPGFPFAGFVGTAPARPAAAPMMPQSAPTQDQQHHHSLFQQAVLMQQQAMILSQIQYLQQLQTHRQSTTAQGTAPGYGAVPGHGMFPPMGHFGHHYPHGYGMPHPAAYGHGLNHAHVPAHGPGFPAPPAPGAAAVAAEPRERGPVVQAFREILPLFDIRLAMKMAFMLFIIGQDTPTDRLIVLVLMSFGAYLHITGIVGKIFEILKRWRGEQGADANANAADPNANVNQSPNAQDRLGAVTRYLRISSDRGFIHDIRYFVTGLLLSLVPAWHPQPLNADGAAPARPEPIIADAGAEIPMQGI